VTFLRKLAWLFRRDQREADLRAELEFHLHEEAESRSGADATWAARRELGNVALVAENTRSQWGWTLIEQFAQDVRYAWRTMRQNRAFTVLAVLSLALGIGANTAIYSFMDTIMMRSLPVKDPRALAVLNWRMKSATMRGTVMHGGSGTSFEDKKTGSTEAGIFPYPAVEELRKSTDVFSSLFAYYPMGELNVMVGDQAEVTHGEYVSGEYFTGLSVPPAAGRLIDTGDDRDAAAVAVLTFAYSRRRFGDASSAVGQTVRINNRPFTVIGVAPPEFFGVDPSDFPDVFTPFHANQIFGESRGSYVDPNYYWVEMMGRLRPGVTLTQAQSRLAPRFQQWAASTASTDHERSVLPALWVREGAGGLDSLRRQYSKPLYVLLAMVGLILAIACANIANLLLARSAARKREMAVRLSMGAGRWRVIRQLLTESVLLASVGGALGVLFAIWGVRFLTVLLANGREDFPLHADLNWHVLAVAAAMSILTGIVFGLAPALQATKVDVIPALKETRGGDRRPRVRLRFLRVSLSQALVVSQVALSLLMLVAAGLFVRTLSNLESITLGFNRENLLLFAVNAAQAGHKGAERDAFYDALQKQLTEIPGVRAASAANSQLIGRGSWFTPTYPLGKKPVINTHVLATGAAYFATMQIPLIAGRDFDQHDSPNSPPVAIVNEAWAKANFGDRNPIGEYIQFENARKRLKEVPLQIVGLVRNTRYGAITGGYPATVYVPFVQGTYYPAGNMVFALRTAGDPLRFVTTVREIVRRADSRVPVTKVRTQAADVDRTMNQEIIFARLCTGLSILALVIACIGLYGTMAYTVARRTGEIGIRMALGARRAHVLRMVMVQVGAMAAVGLAIGVPVVKTLSYLVESFLYEVKPNDPYVIWAAALTLTLAAAIAGYGPAWRASRIDPMQALRHE
jgi:macrolide transport system ATP-binding/permease protein